jgi:DNA-binding transcriptional LysR family regulator
VKNRHFRSVPGPGNARDGRPGTHPSATSPGPIATHRPENGCGSAVDRTILLTLEGEKVFRYADEIFSLGRELLQAVKGEPRHAPMMPSLRVRAFSHLLGETSVSIYGAAALARSARRKFPQSLHGAPMLLQTANTALRQSLDQWFDVHQIVPTIVGEVEDMAMLQTLGEHGLGLFAAPTVMRREICRRYHVAWVGELDKVREKFYAISVERRISHPAVRLIADQAKRRLFP